MVHRAHQQLASTHSLRALHASGLKFLKGIHLLGGVRRVSKAAADVSYEFTSHTNASAHFPKMECTIGRCAPRTQEAAYVSYDFRSHTCASEHHWPRPATMRGECMPAVRRREEKHGAPMHGKVKIVCV